MINLDDKMLRQLQLIELEMLIEVDRICRKYDIKYSLDGGTMLGAIRHKGFIPWDDDIDVVMLRSEYEKFYKACKKELDTDRFFLQDYTTDKYYRWGYSKMRRNNTLFLREGQEHTKFNQSIFIDIFIYDNVPDQPIIRQAHWLFCYCMRKILYSEVGRKNAKTTKMKTWYEFLSFIPRDFVFKLIRMVGDKCNQHETEYARAYTFPYRKKMKYGQPLEFFNDYIDVEFENHTFKILKEYDTYLSNLYDDYMQLPPVEQRKVHPVSKIKLIDID